MNTPPLIMILARKPVAISFVDDFNEDGYRTWVCINIDQAVLDVVTVRPDLLLIVDHFIESFRDPLEVYFYLRNQLKNSLLVVIIGFRHSPENLAHLDLAVFDLMQISEAMDYIYHVVPVISSSK